MNFGDSFDWPPHSPPKPQPSRAALEDMSECCICMETYTKEIRAPVTIPCGHTFCKSCVNKFIKAKVIQCCVCNVVTIGFTKFSKNYAMLQMLEKLNLLTDEDGLKRPKSAESYNASDIPDKIYGNIGEKQFNQYSQFYLGFMKNYLNSNLGKTNQTTKKTDLQNAINKTDQVISAVKRCFEKPKSLYHNPPDPFFHLARTSNMLPPDLLTIDNADLMFQNVQEDDDDVIFLQSTNSIGPTRRKRQRTTANRNSATIPPLAPLVATPPTQSGTVQNDLNTEIAIFENMLESIDSNRPGYQQVRDAVNNNLGNLNRPNFDPNYNPYSFPPAPVSLPGQLFQSYNYGNPSSSQASQSQPSMFLSSQPQNPFNFPMASSYDQSGPANNTPFDYQQPTSSAFNFSLDNKPITSSAAAVDPFAAPIDQFNNSMNPLTQLRQQFARNQRTVLSRFPYSRAH